MYLAPPVAAVVLLLAAVGALALVTSVGVFVFTAGLPDAPELPASEVVAAHTGNVRVVRPHSFADCDCHDAWDQCPCVEAGHGKGCACCGYGTCGPLAADAS